MKTFRPILMLLFAVVAFSVSAQNDNNLPATWDRDFRIILNYDNSMGQAHTTLRLTYDSCIYETDNPRDGHKKRVSLMTNTEREAILKKLHEFKAGEIESNHILAVVSDGWSESICFNTHCIEGGSSADMSESDKNNFRDSYRYLEDFADKKKAKTIK